MQISSGWVEKIEGENPSKFLYSEAYFNSLDLARSQISCKPVYGIEFIYRVCSRREQAFSQQKR